MTTAISKRHTLAASCASQVNPMPKQTFLHTKPGHVLGGGHGKQNDTVAVGVAAVLSSLRRWHLSEFCWHLFVKQSNVSDFHSFQHPSLLCVT
eukprot:m.240784 g.240784  ORF g.240784 m.240784 type:complete len:93 (-) comp19421_c0_seq9:31-309(-)